MEAVAAHAEVSQVSGAGGELRGRDLKRLIGAATVGTQYEDQFTVESVWRKVCREFPDKLQAANKVCVDDARSQWTTYQNLQQWFDDAKQDLFESGLCIDHEVGMGTRGSKRGVKSSRHVTGVYKRMQLGNHYLQCTSFDSGAKVDANFRVKTKWLEGLPTVTGRFGCPTTVESSSFFAVRTRGSMDDTLIKSYVEQVILPLFPNISKHSSFDAETGKLLAGPVILKLDSGPGRIVASHESISKREAFLEMGLIILSGLPNSTSVQQEMDALYGPFKSASYARGEMILIEKIKNRGMLRATPGATGASSILSLDSMTSLRL
ncbi:hypothetical protein MHU86_22287 [Fragilaria crotonensis]|nr:hypothetical protein MHU86_22287 [Fragilaria crotonensis]